MIPNFINCFSLQSIRQILFFVFRLLNMNGLQIIPHQAFKNLKNLELMYVSNGGIYFKSFTTVEIILGLRVGGCSQIDRQNVSHVGSFETYSHWKIWNFCRLKWKASKIIIFKKSKITVFTIAAERGDVGLLLTLVLVTWHQSSASHQLRYLLRYRRYLLPDSWEVHEEQLSVEQLRFVFFMWRL